MGGFVRVFSSRSGGSGFGNVSNQIMFSTPAILYSYDDDSYKYMPNKKGFSFTETADHNYEDNEGVALCVIGLDPVKDYNLTFTLRASKATSTTYEGSKSNAVGFTQSFDNAKVLGDNRLFAITDSRYNSIYKSIRFDNGNIGGGELGPEIINYIPITSVSTTPAEYSLTIKKGCNGMAFLCFELAFPNVGPITYYFENFNIVDNESPISEGSPMSLYCYSVESAHINGYTQISNLNLTDPYQVIKVNVKGKCTNGTATIQMKYGATQASTVIDLGTISGEEDFDVTYTLGVTSLMSNNLTIVGTYNPGIYPSGSYTPVSSIYSDDEIEITCTATGSDSVLFQNSYKNPSGNMMADNIESEAVARQIATEVGIIFYDYGSRIATYTTYENEQIVYQRAKLLGYNVVSNSSRGTFPGDSPRSILPVMNDL